MKTKITFAAVAFLMAGFMVTPSSLAADRISDGEYHMKMSSGQFQIRINGNGGTARGKTYAENKFRPWRRIVMTSNANNIIITAYGYKVTVAKRSITPTGFRGTMNYQNRTMLGNHAYKKQ